MRFLSIFFTLILFATHRSAYAGSVNNGGNCSTADNKLQVGSFQFWSDCNSVTFCTDQGICKPKGCRRDEFPFGYSQNADLPPKCPSGQFCPDEGSACQAVLAVGSPCQLNRDDQCEPAPNFQTLRDNSGRGLNFNGSVCLNNVCMWANATLGTSCTVENVPYIAYGESGEFIDIVSRGNCQLGLYCDSVKKVCMTSLAIGAACAADKECDSWNCLSSGFCGPSASTPRQFGAWVYFLVALGIVGSMSGTLTGLYVTHRKQREQERAKRAQYWREQNAFHQNLMQMRETARASLQSLPNQGARGGDYGKGFPDESSSFQKTSGLRYVTDNASSEFGERVGPWVGSRF